MLHVGKDGRAASNLCASASCDSALATLESAAGARHSRVRGCDLAAQAKDLNELEYLGERVPIKNDKTRVSILRSQQLLMDLNTVRERRVWTRRRLAREWLAAIGGSWLCFSGESTPGALLGVG
eukprot:6197926-Pleurochrysis_carterae.AAC.1